MELPYLTYQLTYHGLKDVRVRTRRRYDLTGWSIYDPEEPPQPGTLCIVHRQQLPGDVPPGVLLCVTGCPAEQTPPRLDGLFLPCSTARAVSLVHTIFHDYDRWEFALSYGGDLPLDTLLELSTPVLHMPMCLIDNSLHNIAQNRWYTELVEQPGDQPPSTDSAYWAGHFGGHTHRKGVFIVWLESDQKDLLCYNIILSNKFYARFLASVEDPQYQAMQERLFTRLSAALEVIFADQRAAVRYTVQTRDFQEAVEALLDGRQPGDAAVLERNRWFLSDSYQVVVFRFGQAFLVEEGDRFLFTQLRSVFPEGCVLMRDRHFILVRNLTLDQDNDDDFGARLPVFLREHVAKAGISNTFPGGQTFAPYLRQAFLALQLGEIHDPDFWYYHFHRYALPYLLSRCVSEFPAEQVACPALMTLRQWDETHHSTLYETLRLYLTSCCNASRTAQSLHIHRTSLIKRLGKIEALTALNLDDTDTQLYLLLSYQLLERT